MEIFLYCANYVAAYVTMPINHQLLTVSAGEHPPQHKNQYYNAAVTVISTKILGLAMGASQAARAGRPLGSTQSSHSSLSTAKSRSMSLSQTRAVNSLDLSVPARCRRSSISASTC